MEIRSGLEEGEVVFLTPPDGFVPEAGEYEPVEGAPQTGVVSTNGDQPTAQPASGKRETAEPAVTGDQAATGADGSMMERWNNMSDEQKADMRKRFENMTPEQLQELRKRYSGGQGGASGAGRPDPGGTGTE